MINVLILISQGFNVATFGDPDEMFSSRCYRLRNASGFWSTMQTIIDVSPLGLWHDPDRGHCESCYFAEKRRLQDRLAEFSE